MEVSEEVAEMFKEFDRKEAAFRLRTYRHKAYYSLVRDDGLEHEAVFVALSPHELYERKVTMQIDNSHIDLRFGCWLTSDRNEGGGERHRGMASGQHNPKPPHKNAKATGRHEAKRTHEMT